MRNTSGTYITLYYPDALCFAFNPVTFRSANTLSMTVTATAFGRSVTATYRGIGETDFTIFADVQGLVQALWKDINTEIDYASNDPTDTGATVGFNVSATHVSQHTETFNVSSFVVWGALNPDGKDVFNGYRRVKWFAEYPFTMGFYAGGAGSILFSKNESLQHYASIAGQGMFSVSSDEIPDGADYSLVYDYAGQLAQATFDSTFDLTFALQGNAPQTLVMRVDIDRCKYKDVVYLRWIDRHGFYCYWLFEKRNVQRATRVIMDFTRPDLQSYEIGLGYQRGAGRRQAFARNDVLPVCAPLVDAEMYDYIFDIATSPVVDMYTEGGEWVSVGVQAGTYTQTDENLQDFVVNILLPTTPTQRL